MDQTRTITIPNSPHVPQRMRRFQRLTLSREVLIMRLVNGPQLTSEGGGVGQDRQ